MSTKERRQRDLADREQLFLDKAQELIQRDGLLNLQMEMDGQPRARRSMPPGELSPILHRSDV